MPGRAGSAALPARAPIAVDGVGIGLEIARGVGRGARALAQHVEGIAELAVRAGARQRLLDGLAEHEMRAEQPHRLPGRDPHRRQAEPLHDAVDDAVRRLAGLDDARGEPERPGRGRDQERAGAFGLATSRRRRACPRSGGRRWRRPAPAAAPRPAPSAPGPPWSRANRRAGNPRCRRGRRHGRGWPRPAAGRGHRCGPRRPRRATPRPASAGASVSSGGA